MKHSIDLKSRRRHHKELSQLSSQAYTYTKKNTLLTPFNLTPNSYTKPEMMFRNFDQQSHSHSLQNPFNPLGPLYKVYSLISTSFNKGLELLQNLEQMGVENKQVYQVFEKVEKTRRYALKKELIDSFGPQMQFLSDEDLGGQYGREEEYTRSPHKKGHRRGMSMPINFTDDTELKAELICELVTLEKTVRTLIRGLASGSGGVQTPLHDLMAAKEQFDSMNFTESARNTVKDKDYSLSQLDSSVRQNRLHIAEIQNKQYENGYDFEIPEEGVFKKKISKNKVELATFGKRTVAQGSNKKIGLIKGFNEVVREVERRQQKKNIVPSSDRHQYEQTKKSNFKISSDSSNYGGHQSSRKSRNKSKPSTKRSRQTDKKEAFTNIIKMNSHRSYNDKRPPPLFDTEFSSGVKEKIPRSISPVKPRLFKEDYNQYYADEADELEMIHERAQQGEEYYQQANQSFDGQSNDSKLIFNGSGQEYEESDQRQGMNLPPNFRSDVSENYIRGGEYTSGTSNKRSRSRSKSNNRSYVQLSRHNQNDTGNEEDMRDMQEMIGDLREGINIDLNYRSQNSRKLSSGNTINTVSIDESDVRPASMSMDSRGIQEKNAENPSNIATEEKQFGGYMNNPMSLNNVDFDDLPSQKDSYLPSDIEEDKKTFMGYTKFQTEDDEDEWIPPLDSEDVMSSGELMKWEMSERMGLNEKKQRSVERRSLTDRIHRHRSTSKGIPEVGEEDEDEPMTKSTTRKHRKVKKDKKDKKKKKKDKKEKKEKKSRRKKKSRLEKGASKSKSKSKPKTKKKKEVEEVVQEEFSSSSIKDTETQNNSQKPLMDSTPPQPVVKLEKTEKNFFSARNKPPTSNTPDHQKAKTPPKGANLTGRTSSPYSTLRNPFSKHLPNYNSAKTTKTAKPITNFRTDFKRTKPVNLYDNSDRQIPKPQIKHYSSHQDNITSETQKEVVDVVNFEVGSQVSNTIRNSVSETLDPKNPIFVTQDSVNKNVMLQSKSTTRTVQTVENNNASKMMSQRQSNTDIIQIDGSVKRSSSKNRLSSNFSSERNQPNSVEERGLKSVPVGSRGSHVKITPPEGAEIQEENFLKNPFLKIHSGGSNMNFSESHPTYSESLDPLNSRSFKSSRLSLSREQLQRPIEFSSDSKHNSANKVTISGRREHALGTKLTFGKQDSQESSRMNDHYIYTPISMTPDVKIPKLEQIHRISELRNSSDFKDRFMKQEVGGSTQKRFFPSPTYDSPSKRIVIDGSSKPDTSRSGLSSHKRNNSSLIGEQYESTPVIQSDRIHYTGGDNKPVLMSRQQKSPLNLGVSNSLLHDSNFLFHSQVKNNSSIQGSFVSNFDPKNSFLKNDKMLIETDNQIFKTLPKESSQLMPNHPKTPEGKNFNIETIQLQSSMNDVDTEQLKKPDTKPFPKVEVNEPTEQDGSQEVSQIQRSQVTVKSKQYRSQDAFKKHDDKCKNHVLKRSKSKNSKVSKSNRNSFITITEPEMVASNNDISLKAPTTNTNQAVILSNNIQDMNHSDKSDLKKPPLSPPKSLRASKPGFDGMTISQISQPLMTPGKDLKKKGTFSKIKSPPNYKSPTSKNKKNIDLNRNKKSKKNNKEALVTVSTISNPMQKSAFSIKGSQSVISMTQGTMKDLDQIANKSEVHENTVHEYRKQLFRQRSRVASMAGSMMLQTVPSLRGLGLKYSASIEGGLFDKKKISFGKVDPSNRVLEEPSNILRSNSKSSRLGNISLCESELFNRTGGMSQSNMFKSAYKRQPTMSISQIADIGPLPDYQEFNVTYPGLEEKIDYSLAIRNSTQGAFVSYNTKITLFEIVDHTLKLSEDIQYPKKFKKKNTGWKDIVYVPKLEMYLLYTAKAGIFNIYALDHDNQLNKLIETEYSPIKFSKFFIPRPDSTTIYLNFWEEGIKKLEICQSSLPSSTEHILAPIKADIKSAKIEDFIEVDPSDPIVSLICIHDGTITVTEGGEITFYRNDQYVSSYQLNLRNLHTSEEKIACACLDRYSKHLVIVSDIEQDRKKLKYKIYCLECDFTKNQPGNQMTVSNISTRKNRPEKNFRFVDSFKMHDDEDLIEEIKSNHDSIKDVAFHPKSLGSLPIFYTVGNKDCFMSYCIKNKKIKIFKESDEPKGRAYKILSEEGSLWTVNNRGNIKKVDIKRAEGSMIFQFLM